MRRLQHQLLALAISSPFWSTATALAQNAPRDPSVGQRTPVWLGYLVAAVFALVLVLLTLLPSKRQSEDL